MLSCPFRPSALIQMNDSYVLPAARVCGDGTGSCVIAGAEDRARLAALIGDRSRPPKHTQRVWIVLHSAERLSGV